MITPTSAKSKQYEALGIDEIANDIETVFNEVNSITTDGLPVVADGVTITGTGTTLDPLVAVGGGGGTTVEVNISSAQILAMGATPIELLPAPGAGKYYDVEKIILEYTHVTTAYTFTGHPYLKDSGGYFTLNLYDFTNEGANTVVRINGTKDYWAVGVTVNDFKVGYEVLNTSLLLTTYNGADPTLGDGTLRVIITYTLRTFGA